MPKPGGDRQRTDEVDWDFSFVGPRHGHDDPGRDGAAGESAEIDWDFSFVDGEGGGSASRRSTDVATDPDEIDWDFSFVGAPVDAPLVNGPTDGGEPEWDFSFVDGVRDTSVVEPLAASIPELEVDELRVQDDEAVVEPPTPAAADAARLDTEVTEVVAVEEFDPSPSSGLPAPAPEDHSGDITRPAAYDVAPTDELERPARIDDLDRDAGRDLQPIADPTEELESHITDSTPLRGEPRHEPVKVLTICTHNRTRSVMMMALLQAGFDRAVGEGRVMVRSLGFGPEGEPAIPDAVEEMEDRGLDVSNHRSLQVTTPRVEPADLILTAEREHVVKVAESSPDAFRRTFTLPEFCRLIAHDPVPGSRTLREWLHSMSSARTPATYLTDDVPQVDDPTGSPKRQFALATATIESMCDTVVDLLEVSVGRPGWR